MFIFQTNYELFNLKDLYNIKKRFKIKKLSILDYGCGRAIHFDGKIDSKQIDSVYLYDKNKRLKNYLTKKFSNRKKIFVNFNKDQVFNDKINLIIFSSVIQYIGDKELEKIFIQIVKKYKKKKIYIFLNDIPTKNRFIEFLFLPLIDFKKFLYSLTLIFNMNYLNLKFYLHDIKKKIYITNHFSIKNLGYTSNSKYFREKYLLELNNK